MGPPRRGQASIVTDSESDGEEIGNSEEIGTSDLYNFMKKMKSDLTKEIHDSVKELNATVGKHTIAICKLEEFKDTTTTDLKKMKNDMNDKEQRDRNYSMQIFNLKVPSKLSPKPPSPIEVLTHVYNELVFPVLTTAVANQDISSVPKCLELLEFGHTLPMPRNSKSDISPIIVSFFSRSYRTLFMKNKRNLLISVNKDVDKDNRISVYEDLTTANFQLMKKLSVDPRLEKAFSLNRQIKYILNNDPGKKMRSLKTLDAQIESLDAPLESL